MKIVLVSFVLVLCIFVLIGLILISSNRFYCMVFEREEYKTGKFVCKHLNDMRFVERNVYDKFTVSDYTIEVDDRKLKIHYFVDANGENTLGVWENDKIIFCGFDIYHFNKIVKYIESNEEAYSHIINVE